MALGWRGQYYRYKEFFLNVLDLYKKKPDLRMFLETMLSLTTVIVFIIFALKPTAITIINLLKEIGEREDTISKLEIKLRNLTTAKANYQAESASIPIIESAIPNLPSPDDFAGQIQGLANRNLVKVLGISIGETVIVGEDEKKKNSRSDFEPLPVPARDMPISISISGNYPSLISFLKDIENLRRPIRMDILGINSSKTESGNTIVVVISGRVPFLGQNIK